MTRPVSKENYPDYTQLGDVCRGRVGMQCQYGSRYANPGELCGHLRYLNLDTGCYHDILIHKDDVEEFVRLVLAKRHQERW